MFGADHLFQYRQRALEERPRFLKVALGPKHSKRELVEARRCVAMIAKRVRSQPDEPHEGLGSSELVTPYRSRSAFASSVRPSASRASAVTRAVLGPIVIVNGECDLG
jgi:hypothetical protein